MRRRAALVVVTALLGATATTLSAAPVGAIDADAAVVVSEVYGGGGNSGAPFTNDFVELFNRSGDPVDVSGDSVQYASGTGTGNLGANAGQLVVLPAGSVIPAGGRYLVQLAGGANGDPLPAPDATGTINMSASAGKVAYVDGAESVGCNGASSPCSPAQTARVVDLVGYGTANWFEGTNPAPALSNTTAALRDGDGCDDTNDNAADFTAGAPAPVGAAGTPAPCGGDGDQQPPVVTAPATLGTLEGTPASASITAADEDGTVESLEVTNPAALPDGITFTSGGPDSGTLDVTASAAPGTYPITFTATDDGGAVGTATTTVTVEPLDACAAPETHDIADVQGSGPTSPVTGQQVTIEGVVTGDYQASGQFGGFFVQDVTPDADPATSDGVRVFNNAAPVASGDRVQVTGTVTEFASVASVPLYDGSETQLSAATVAVCESGLGLPPATAIDFPFDPVTGGADGQERYEGMRVALDEAEPLAVTEVFTLGRFGELTLSPGAPLFNENNSDSTRTENLRNQVVLDDGRSGQNLADLPYTIGGDGVTLPRVGDVVSEGEVVTGVLAYAFGVYRIEPLVPGTDVDFTRANPRPAAPDEVGGDVHVASFNVLNYFVDFGGENRGADGPAELQRQQDKLVSAIVGLDADVLGLIEIANDDGDALDTLVAALNAAQADPADHYTAVEAPVLNPPEDALVGGTFGTDAIRVALIHRHAVVTPVGPAAAVDDPILDRPSIVQAYEPVGGGRVFSAVVNHFKSKGSCPAPGADPANDDNGQGCWNVKRIQQAEALLDGLEALGVDDQAVLLGDFNAYAEEDPIEVLEAAGYVRVVEAFLDASDSYSYVFAGELGELDHAFVAPALAAAVTGADIWHINSVEAPAYDYNDFNQAALYAPDPYRSSDHDPVLLGLDLELSVPAGPTSVTAQPGWAAATVTWTQLAPSAGESPVTGYTVRARSSSDAVAAEVAVGPEARTADLGPLTPGTAYTVVVVADSDAGPSAAGTTTVVAGGRPARALPLVPTASCRNGSAVFTVRNLNAVAAGFAWRAPVSRRSGSGVVPARGSVEVVVDNPSFVEILLVDVARQPQLPGLAFGCRR